MKIPTYDEILPYIEKKLVSEQVHPEDENVRIFNYSNECQYARAWDDVTRQCRGLILNIVTGEVIARPFPKFFNYQEHIANGDVIPDEVPTIAEKLDGSLGILYWLGDTPHIATRGAFTSDQAVWATKWFRDHAVFDEYDRGLTYLFEILVFWNRIVVSYDYEGLILLAINETNRDVSHDIYGPRGILSQRVTQNDAREYMGPTVVEVETLSSLQEGNDKEGLPEAQTEAEEVFSSMEQGECGEGVRTSSGSISKAKDISGQTEGRSVCRLREDLSSVRDGFRPHERNEMERCFENQNAGGDPEGNKEMRFGVFKLSQNQNVPHKKIRTPKAVELTDIEQLISLDEPNSEGFVVFYPKANFRMKIKFPEYVRLHKLVTGVNEIAIWEFLRDGKTLDELLAKVPDEFYSWVTRVKETLVGKFNGIQEQALEEFSAIAKDLGEASRKEYALRITKMAVPAIGFSLYDG